MSDLGGNVPVGNGLEQPIITNRSIKSTVVVRDQQTVVIGGLISNRNSDSESKFPLLGDLPIFGWLFKQWSGDKTKTNLVLVLTPYVVRSREDFQAIYDRKLQERTEFVEAFLGGASDYNPYIEYSKKTGPLALLMQDVNHEMTKLENGGAGLPDEVPITPEAVIEPIEDDGAQGDAPPAPEQSAADESAAAGDASSADDAPATEGEGGGSK